jgi:hypothetical protein
MGQVTVYNLSGGGGSLYIKDTAAHAGDFFALQCTATTVFADLTGNMENETNFIVDATEFAAGTVIYGRYSSISLTSGSVIAYKA